MSIPSFKPGLSNLSRLILIPLFCISQDSYGQKVIDGKPYQDLLWGENQEFDANDFPKGGMILTPDDFILTTGKFWKGEPPSSVGEFQYKDQKFGNAGLFNNSALQFYLKNLKENRSEAISMLEEGVRFDPHFFPFRYNLARLYQISGFDDRAVTQFEFAAAEIPEYYRIYLHLGTMLIRKKLDNEGVAYLKQAISLNKFNTEALVLLGEYYLESGMRNRADLYFNSALKIDDSSPNARLGIARLYMHSKKFFHAYKVLKKTELFDESGKLKPYNKKLHFYFGEVSSYVGDYIRSEKEYTELLKYPNDPFFGYFSIKNIEKRRDIAAKFALIQKSQTEMEKAP